MFGFLFKRARKQKAEELINNALISIDSLVPMPRREDFSSDSLKIKAIDDFKKEYLSMLKTNRTIVSHDLMPKELHDYKNIYFDLLVGLCLEDDTDVNFDKINYSCDKSLDFELSIKRTKIMLYYNEVAVLYEEASLRLVALSELLEENAFNKNRTTTILNEIRNMKFALFTFGSQQQAMEKEMINYFSDIVNSHDEMPEEKRYNAINYHLKELKEMALLLIPDEVKRLEMLRLDPIILIAKLEQLLEMFVYTHAEMLDDLEAQVLKLHNKMIEIINEREPFSDKELKLEVRKLENMFKAFSKFSRNKVQKRDLELLYEVKFWLFTHDLSKIKPDSMLNSATFTEVECYQDIIFKKIENILKGENINVLHLADRSGEKIPFTIRYISDVLKDGNSTYSTWDILNDGKLLSFLIAFDTYWGIADFFNLPSSKEDFPNLNYYDEIFKWNSVMPLSTYYRIKKCNRMVEVDNDKSIKDYDPMHELYLLSDNYKEIKKEYIMPEGLREIIIPINVMDTKYKPVIEYIQIFANYRPVIMPSTLRRLDGNLFDKTVVNKVVLNKDLQEIKNYALLVHSLKELTILGNPTNYFLNSIPFFQLHTLDINWRANMLHDPEVIQKLYTVREVKTDDESKYDVIDYDDIYPYHSQSDTERYVFSPVLVVLNVLDDDGTLLKSLKRDDLTFVFKRRSEEQTESNEVGYLEANMIGYGISKVIRECVQTSRILKKEE